jgi:hypothetical protein
MKLFECESGAGGCHCTFVAESYEMAVKNKPVCNHSLPCIDHITAVTDKDGNKYRVLLVDDRACQGGGCCVTCGEEANQNGR